VISLGRIPQFVLLDKVSDDVVLHSFLPGSRRYALALIKDASDDGLLSLYCINLTMELIYARVFLRYAFAIFDNKYSFLGLYEEHF
jgi:hypothetical protein